MNTKRIILILTHTLCFYFCVWAQNEHLTFKGVPINGTLNEFISKMKKSGFTHVATEDGTAVFTGDFAGYKDCNIGVSTLKQKDLVEAITVIFPERDTWSSLSFNYYNWRIQRINAT